MRRRLRSGKRGISQGQAGLPSAFRVPAGFLHPPKSPHQCIFAQATVCISADLTTRISPCQFGGRSVCAECGCVASGGLASFANYKLAGLVQISDVFSLSRRIGAHWASIANREGASEMPIVDGQLSLD